MNRLAWLLPWCLLLAGCTGSISGGPGDDAGEEPIEDAGEDAGEDSGQDSGEDGGGDGFEDGGEDGIEDGGEDSGEDAGGDGFEDGGEDGIEDGGEDSAEDAGEDGIEDGGEDSAEDAGEDGIEDGGEDSAEDEGEDGIEDGGEDGFEDAGEDDLVDAGEDTGEDTGEDVGEETVDEEIDPCAGQPDLAPCGVDQACYGGACLALGCAGEPPLPTGCDTWGVPQALDHALCQPAGACDGGDEASGDRTPTWRERAFLTLVNAARAAPVAYRDAYMSFRDASGANVFDSAPAPRVPLAWSHLAAEAARFHATDRTGCTTGEEYAHNLCDGTAFATWVGWFLPGGAGEVFFEWPYAARSDLVLGIVNGFLCDGMTWDMAGYPGEGCVSDADAAAGHRRLLVLDLGYHQLGAGHARVGARTEWAGVPSSGAAPALPPIASAAHFYHGGQIVFGASIWDADAPQLAEVVLDGDARPLALELGSAELGFYTLAEAPAAGCRSYHFVVIDASGLLWRYPATGELRTTLEGGCAEDFVE